MIFSSYVNTQSFIVFGGLLELYSLCFSIILYCMFFYFGTDRRPLGVFNQSITAFRMCQDLPSQSVAQLMQLICIAVIVKNFLRLDKEEIRADYTRAIEELAKLKGVPVSSLESKRRSRASNDHIDIDSSKSYSVSSSLLLKYTLIVGAGFEQVMLGKFLRPLLR